MFGQQEENTNNVSNTVVSAPVNNLDDVTQEEVTGDYIDSDPITPTAGTNIAPVVSPTSGVMGGDNDLLALKQQALTQLSPLVNHLEQSPEEKFRTTMMMIQASDNSALIKPAYEAALAIPDEKVRAQALLDVVNEINYFTQQSESQS